MRACAFFPPSLDPVLNGRKGHKDAMVAPQVPTRWAVGQAILDHEPHGQVHHAVGVLTAGWCEIGEVRVEVLVTFRTVMLRIRDDKITRTPHVEIAQIVQRPMGLLVPIGRVTTTRTRLTRVVATVQDDLGLRQVCKRCHTFGRVGAIRTWTEHRVALLAQRLGPELYDQGLLGATRYPRYSLREKRISGHLRPNSQCLMRRRGWWRRWCRSGTRHSDRYSACCCCHSHRQCCS